MSTPHENLDCVQIPSSDEAELRVVGAMLIDLDACRRQIDRLRSEDFSSPQLRMAFLALRALQKGTDDDATAALVDSGACDSDDVDDFIETAMETSGSIAALHHHVDKVLDLSVRRAALEVCSETIDLATGVNGVGSADLVDRAIAKLQSLRPHIDDAPVAQLEIVPSFPVDSLPTPVRDYVIQSAQAIDCAPEMIAVPAITLAGTAIGTTAVIELKRGWREGGRLWTAVVATPGTAKSAASGTALRPAREHQLELASHYRAVFTQFEADLAEFETLEAEWRKRLKSGHATVADRPERPQQPPVPQVWTSDATVEAVAAVLEANPRGIVFVADELNGWARGMDAYKARGADRQTYLSWWSGESTAVNRRCRDPLHIERPFLNVTGGIQPEILADLADERGRSDGFLDRILFAYPQERISEWSPHEVDPVVAERYSDVFATLWRMSAADAEGNPRVLQLTPDAREYWADWHSSNVADLRDPDFPQALRGAWAKMPRQLARLALVLQLTRAACGEGRDDVVDKVSIAGAVALVDYFKGHARRVLPLFRLSATDRRVAAAAAWIRRRPSGPDGAITVTSRDAQMARVAGVKSATEARALLKELADRGHGSLVDGKRGALVLRVAQQTTLPTQDASP